MDALPKWARGLKGTLKEKELGCLKGFIYEIASRQFKERSSETKRVFE